MAKAKKTTKTTHKSIGPKFFAVLLVFLLTLISLVGNLFTLHTVRAELKTAFDYELVTAVETLAESIDILHESDPSARDTALKMVDEVTWNDGRRHFWASNADYTEILAGKKDHDEFYNVAEQETKFDFTVLAGYDKEYFEENAYPDTKILVYTSITATLVVAVFALGACAIVFYRSASR